MKYFILIILLINIIISPLFPADFELDKKPQDKTIFLEQRIKFLLFQCQALLEKADWGTKNDGKQVNGFRLGERYDEIIVKITGEYEKNYYTFIVWINKNGKHSINKFRFTEEAAGNDDKLGHVILSALSPDAVLREGIGDFRKSYSSIFSFGYSRTSDQGKIYPSPYNGNIHLSWQLEYDPAAKIFLPETQLAVGDYFSFSVYLDFSKAVHENFFNVDLLMFGKNKYSGSAERGTRFMYGFFNGLEYFRPGFSDTAMKWNRPIYHDRPYIQYTIWRFLQGNIMVSRRNGPTLYSAELMAGAGVGIGPSSLLIADTNEEEEKDLPDVFRSIRKREQNYYYSYTLPARLSLSADQWHGFRFYAGYNYYFFTPVFLENIYDMLHIVKGSVGYYLSYDILLNFHYEFWLVQSMLYDKTAWHHWNRLIIEFKNYF